VHTTGQSCAPKKLTAASAPIYRSGNPPLSDSVRGEKILTPTILRCVRRWLGLAKRFLVRVPLVLWRACRFLVASPGHVKWAVRCCGDQQLRFARRQICEAARQTGVRTDSWRCRPVTRPCVIHTGAGSSRRRPSAGFVNNSLSPSASFSFALAPTHVFHPAPPLSPRFQCWFSPPVRLGRVAGWR
jgi:hypothetical protein